MFVRSLTSNINIANICFIILCVLKYCITYVGYLLEVPLDNKRCGQLMCPK